MKKTSIEINKGTVSNLFNRNERVLNTLKGAFVQKKGMDIDTYMEKVTNADMGYIYMKMYELDYVLNSGKLKVINMIKEMDLNNINRDKIKKFIFTLTEEVEIFTIDEKYLLTIVMIEDSESIDYIKQLISIDDILLSHLLTVEEKEEPLCAREKISLKEIFNQPKAYEPYNVEEDEEEEEYDEYEEDEYYGYYDEDDEEEEENNHEITDEERTKLEEDIRRNLNELEKNLMSRFETIKNSNTLSDSDIQKLLSQKYKQQLTPLSFIDKSNIQMETKEESVEENIKPGIYNGFEFLSTIYKGIKKGTMLEVTFYGESKFFIPEAQLIDYINKMPDIAIKGLTIKVTEDNIK